MFNTSKIAGIALAGAFAATGASAHETYSHSHNGTGYTAPSYGTTTYAAPTVDLGPIEYVQPNSTVQYAQPTTTYIQPATTTTYSTPTYSTPTYTTPTYGTTTYGTTTYTTPSYAAQPTYGTSYGTTYYQPSYTSPQIVAPQYDGRANVRTRLRNQRARIDAAYSRGQLRQGELNRLQRKMQNIREDFRAARQNDGVVDYAEEQQLMRKLDRQSRQIRRLANNRRVAGPAYSRY